VAERDDYNEAIKARDNLLRASGVVFGLSGAAALVGLLLYSLDEPSLYEAAAGGPDPAPNDSADADGQQRRTVMVRLLPRFTVAPTIDGETPTMAAALVVRGRF